MTLRLLRTVRHLRPVQVYGRVLHHLWRPRPDRAPAPPLRQLAGRWQAGATRPPTMTAPATFKFLNVEAALPAAGGWDDPAHARLWRYNLHYFDDLNAAGASDRAQWHHDLVARWVRENPPCAGTGWESYPTSLRVVNWAKWIMSDAAPQPADAMLDSLAVQARWLSGRLEWHIQGNHLWSNAKALACAGALFSGAEADGWWAIGRTLLRRELAEQVLTDGGHFELSPLYHALFLEDVLDLINLATLVPGQFDSGLVDALHGAATRMLRWLRVMTHPDGEIAFFNDAAVAIAAPYAELAAYAVRIGVAVDERPLAAVEMLANSGYVRMSRGPATLLCDVAPVGPDHLPGHAHADTLSFELTLGGQRLCVNTGTGTYDAGPDRRQQRGTPAHSTVCVDGEDSSEVWASFRVGRRARPFDVRWSQSADGGTLLLEGAHDGYSRLGRRVVHRRQWSLDAHGVTIVDCIEGRHRSAVAWFHLAPGWSAVRTGHGTVITGAGPDGRSVMLSTRGAVSVQPSVRHPEFGTAVPATSLKIPLEDGQLTTRWTWQ
jgi:uncharacterized heparinase superfamily protein